MPIKVCVTIPRSTERHNKKYDTKNELKPNKIKFTENTEDCRGL